MVVIKVDDTLSHIEKRLGGLAAKAPKVLCKSINDTAVWARREIANEVRKTYTIKLGGFNHDVKIKRANYSHLEAVIQTAGATFPLNHFKYNVGKRTTTAQVLKVGSSKRPLEIDGRRAFYNKISPPGQKGKEHWQLAQRTSNSRLPIKALFSNSLPKMVGNEKRVYGIVEPKMEDKLSEQIEKHIKKVLEGYE